MFRRLREDIRSIIDRDPAARNGWEVLTCYPGLHAIVMHRWAYWCWQRRMKWLGRFISHLARVMTGIEIHPGAWIGRRVFIDHGFGVVIGETAVVGDDCTIYQGVTLGGTSLSSGAKRHPTLERGVIIGAGAKVLGNFTVGEYAKVGSNAVLLKPVPAGGTAVGNPAHIVQNAVQNSAPGPQQQAAQAAAAPAAVANLFTSYGLSANGDDPLSKALHALIDHAALQQRQIEQLAATMKAAGLDCKALPECDKFDPAQLNKLVE
ncbi:MAG: serine O-acetyltransferase [Burkholderiaceae bacterium]|nr:serine O-acetyltransferase [Burkholderiaceae bacterium]